MYVFISNAEWGWYISTLHENRSLYIRKDGSTDISMTIRSRDDGYCKTRREAIRVAKKIYPKAKWKDKRSGILWV